MKVALIPPAGLENYALRSKFHLALAIPLLMKRRAYAGMYKRVGNLSDYVILDNGANEGQPADVDMIKSYAAMIGCNELVLPDVMYSAADTLKAVKQGLPLLAGCAPSRMAVIQGETIGELRTCVEAFSSMQDIDVVGIPRHTIATTSRSAVRIELANWIEQQYPGRFQIHLLGTHPAYLKEVQAANKYAGHIRSVDSSLPFNYALAGKSLLDTKERIMRPDRYFEEDWSRRANVDLIRDNIDTFMRWAGDEEASRSRVRAVSA